MTLTIKRGLSYENLLILQNGERKKISISEFRKKTEMHDVIRIVDDEYRYIDPTEGYLTHFNLEDTDSIPGKTYILARIVAGGFFRPREHQEQEPLLSLHDVFVATCEEVKTNLSYENLDQSFFKFSMTHIHDRATLKDAIYKRYHVSMPELSRETIMALGVSWQILKIIRKTSFVL